MGKNQRTEGWPCKCSLFRREESELSAVKSGSANWEGGAVPCSELVETLFSPTEIVDVVWVVVFVAEQANSPKIKSIDTISIARFLEKAYGGYIFGSEE